MKIKNYRPSKGFVWALFLIIFITWMVFKCVPLTEKRQEQAIKGKMDYQRRKAAEEFDKYTDEDVARLAKFDSRKYTRQKWGGRFFVIPKEYSSSYGLHFYYPKYIKEMIIKNPDGDFKNNKGFQDEAISIYIGSPQQAALGGRFSDIKNEPCIENMGRFKWNGLYIILEGEAMGRGVGNKEILFHKQRKEICYTALKLLNTQMKEVYYVK